MAIAGLTVSETQRDPSRTGGKFDLPGQIRVERSPREIRLTRTPLPSDTVPTAIYPFVFPGEVVAPEFGLSLQGEHTGGELPVTLRAWRPGDRVKLRHSQSPKKVADVLDRLHVLGDARKQWPVVDWEGRIVWMRGVEVDAGAIRFTVQFLP